MVRFSHESEQRSCGSGKRAYKMFAVVIQAVLLVGSLLWIGRCLWRLPGDILLIKEYASDRNWSEFWMESGLFCFFWGVSIVLFLVFVMPVVRIVITAVLAIANQV